MRRREVLEGRRGRDGNGGAEDAAVGDEEVHMAGLGFHALGEGGERLFGRDVAHVGDYGASGDGGGGGQERLFAPPADVDLCCAV